MNFCEAIEHLEEQHDFEFQFDAENGCCHMIVDIQFDGHDGMKADSRMIADMSDFQKMMVLSYIVGELDLGDKSRDYLRRILE